MVMLVAAAQYCASNDIYENQNIIEKFMLDAGAKNVSLICFPECANLIAKNKQELKERAEPANDSKTIKKIRFLARKHKIITSVGSLMLKQSNQQKIINRGILIGRGGELLATYDKIHMFDANIGDGKIYSESDDFNSGNKIVTKKTEVAHIGFSICYDIRFPQMYRLMSRAGAEIIVTPAAFTAKTGEAHWHVLQRARAIENGCFIIAAAQSGIHADGRQTFGHSLIVNPWGQIIAEAKNHQTELVLAEVDLKEVEIARNAISAWKSD